ncbi:hypothetical protein P5V15_005847 [Pogonomyrmex californicus]
MTYTSLITVLIFGDDLNRNPNGSFTAMVIGCESDMRFLYCALCVLAIFDDWSGMDISKYRLYFTKHCNHTVAILGKDLEFRGGSTFCSVASLFLMRKYRKCIKFTLRFYSVIKFTDL